MGNGHHTNALAVLQALATDPGACALYMFPTKALAQVRLGFNLLYLSWVVFSRVRVLVYKSLCCMGPGFVGQWEGEEAAMLGHPVLPGRGTGPPLLHLLLQQRPRQPMHVIFNSPIGSRVVTQWYRKRIPCVVLQDQLRVISVAK